MLLLRCRYSFLVVPQEEITEKGAIEATMAYLVTKVVLLLLDLYFGVSDLKCYQGSGYRMQFGSRYSRTLALSRLYHSDHNRTIFNDTTDACREKQIFCPNETFSTSGKATTFSKLHKIDILLK